MANEFVFTTEDIEKARGFIKEHGYRGLAFHKADEYFKNKYGDKYTNGSIASCFGKVGAEKKARKKKIFPGWKFSKEQVDESNARQFRD